jgi:serine/threonine-protein kinase
MGKTLELVDSDPGLLSSSGPAMPDAPRVPPDAERVQEALNRILTSRTFRSAEREKTFLRYVVERTLQGRGAEIKEYTVGVEAFGRGDSFDPRRDTIVRTEARNVRLRLERYYAGEGQDDSLRIELPKGGYAAQFTETAERRPDPKNAPADVPAIAPEPSAEPAPIVAPANVPETAAAPELPVSTAAPKTIQATVPEVREPKRLRMPTAAVILAGVIVALGGFWLTQRRAHPRQLEGDSASIAVLPFADLSGGANDKDDKEGEILSDGLTDELIGSLARIPRLHVVARSSVFLYKGRGVDIRKVGHDLNVRNVLEGSVRIASGHIRITAQLEDTSNGYQLWSQSFDRKLSVERGLNDAIAVQDEISMAIMQSLGVQLAGAANLRTGDSPSPGAYRDFLTGLYFLNRSTAENVRTSINYFQRAVAADPNFAPAYSGLADGYSRIAAFTSTPSGEMIPLIRTAAAKALALDDTLGEAHLELARAYSDESNWAAAAREYRRALDLSPSSAQVHRYYGAYLLRIGHPEEALAEARIAVELDPISPSAAQFEARMLYYLRRYDEAAARLQKALALDPSSGILHQALGLVYMARSATWAQGVTESERARELMEGDPWVTGQLGYAYALAGRKAEAREILRQLETGSGEPVRALPVARVYTGLGDREQAFLWLQKAVDQRDVALFLIADPVYDGLRGDPRFHALLGRASLTPGSSSEVSIH